MAFPDAWMNELLAKNDIVSVISSYIELKPKGRRLWGLCPIHGEKTPSFSVSPDKQLFYCFGCHAGGSVIQFVMEMERLTFLEAVQFLASRAGMEMPENVDDQAMRRERAYRERLNEALQLAARFYMETLLGPGGEAGRNYLMSRRLSSDAVKRFGLGYSPDEWDALKKHLFEKGFTQKELLDAGLLVMNENRNTVYDAFRNRIMFPIIGTNNRVLGFGARVLNNKDKPKYINTGDTLLYNKRNNLYGLHLQKGKKCDDLIMVEGYTDVIGLYEAGVTNAVASLGTALTQQQAHLLKRYTARAFIAYDGDSAGQNATIRGLDILSAEGLDVRVIVFPNDQDPDEFIRAEGKDAFDQLKDNALTLNAFKLEAMSRPYALDHENDRERYAMEASAFVASLQPVERERYYIQLAKKTGYSVASLREQGERSGATGNTPLARQRTVPKQRRDAAEESERTRAEASLINAMLQSKEATMLAVEKGVPDILETESFKTAALRIVAAYAAEGVPNYGAIAAQMNQEEADLFSAGTREDALLLDPVRSASDCLARIAAFAVRLSIAQLNEKLKDPALSQEERTKILSEIQSLTRQIKR